MFTYEHGTMTVNGVERNRIDFKQFKEPLHIVLIPKRENVNASPTERLDGTSEFVITVRPYMTRQSTPSFDFMAKWNNDIPMPLRTMVGTKEKETNGMVYMKLHGDIVLDRTQTCMKCGKPITNTISQFFGLGPECGKHNYINPFNSDDELKEAVEQYRVTLKNTTWEGWIIKSAITDIKKV